MDSHTRIVVNAGAQYFRTIVNVLLGIYSTRLVLEALGESNYGLYALIAGVVALLSFVTNAMSATTQRFLSYHHGSGGIEYLKILFGNIFFLHIAIDLAVLIILEFIGLFLFDGFLNIEPDQINAAKFTYQCAIFMVLCSFFASPFRGLLISHQNLVYTSVIDVCDGILKLIIAIIVLNFKSDTSLYIYSLLMSAISIFNILAFVIYCFLKYEECKLPTFKVWDTAIIAKISGFASWVVYSTCMAIGRNQGTAIVINKFYGTVVNTAYGVAVQVNGACMFISGSILNAFSPQIVKTEGENNHESAIIYAKSASKLCYLLMLMAVMPLCAYMEPILKLWLGTVPPYSVNLCRIIILTTLSDQLTTGLSVINKAIGKLKFYSLTVDTIKILTVPTLAILLYINVPLEIAFVCYLFFELTSALIRLPVIRKQSTISIKDWIYDVLLKLILQTVVVGMYYWIVISAIKLSFISIICTTILGCLLAAISAYTLVLNSTEKKIAKEMTRRIIQKFLVKK